MMVFTQEQDAFILMAHYRSGNRNDDGDWTYSLQSTIEQFQEKFPDIEINPKVFATHKRRVVDRFENKHCVCRAKSSGRPSVLTQEVIEDVQTRVAISPQKSIRKLSTQTGKALH